MKQLYGRVGKGWYIFLFPFLAFLFSLSFASYWSIINNSFVSDDYSLISTASNVSLLDPRPLFTCMAPWFVRPVFMLTWWIQIQLFGTAPTPGHVINIMLHAGNASLLFLLLKRLRASTIAAVMAAFLFVVSPLGPEAVTFVAGRSDLIPLFFILSSMIFYSVYLEKDSRFSMAVSIASVLFALFSKENAMILIVLFPAMEIMFGPNSQSYLSLGKRHKDKGISYSRLIISDFRLLVRRPPIVIFLFVFIAYFLIHASILGRIGGYQPLFGVPNVHAIGSSLHTLLAPLNNQLFSTTTIRIFTTFTSILAIFSLIAVLTGWRKAPSQLKRLWVFMATFSLASIMPVAWNLFTVGISNNLLMSHFYYFSLAGLLPMMTIALFEFHDNSRAYVLTITLTFVVLISSNIYVLNVNNRPWEKSAAISWTVQEQTINLFPEPPHNSRFYYQGLPSWVGVWCIELDIEPSIRQKYGRDDLTIKRVGAQHSEDKDIVLLSETRDGYLFNYDSDNSLLLLERGPQ